METILRPAPLPALIVGGIALAALGLSVLWTRPFTKFAPALTPPVVATTSVAEANTSVPARFYEYIEVTESCGPYFDGEPCVNMRSGPGMQYPVLKKLRNGIVFKVASTTLANGRTWYEIGFDGEIHYPERVTGNWYVAADYVHVFSDKGLVMTDAGINASSTKRIVIDISQRCLYAYDGETVFMQQSISTGLELTPTPRGTFWVYRKMPDSYMQGPVAGLSDQYYDLPGVPWDLYFTRDGSAIHGAYWHDRFGELWSHGCVNLPPEQAKILYEWADLGTPVIVQN